MASQKKVVVRQMDGSLLWGYLPSQGILDADALQLLDTSGRVQPVPIRGTKTISYVRDFNLGDSSDPERLGRRAFAGKPRGEGLWLRLQFTDGDTLEGLAPLGVSFLDHLVDDRCLAMTPPDPKSNTYTVLIPRAALADVETVAIIGAGAKRTRPPATADTQPRLFT